MQEGQARQTRKQNSCTEEEEGTEAVKGELHPKEAMLSHFPPPVLCNFVDHLDTQALGNADRKEARNSRSQSTTAKKKELKTLWTTQKKGVQVES